MDRVETKEHINNEIKAIQEFCKVKNCTFTKLPKFDIDFLIDKNGKGIAFMEVKCRTHKYKDFSTQFLSFHKYQSLMNCNKYLPAYFLCKYTDGIYYIHVNLIPLNNIKKGGRNEPRCYCPNDIEFLIHFDRSLMTRL